mmetsp:Transcript_3328/g.4675  ORF Transcript_3328/g.4675 Transcript_3328/m.4675 type:complete len:247 (-) Transcript_3328:246-986(-)
MRGGRHGCFDQPSGLGNQFLSFVMSHLRLDSKVGLLGGQLALDVREGLPQPQKRLPRLGVVGVEAVEEVEGVRGGALHHPQQVRAGLGVDGRGLQQGGLPRRGERAAHQVRHELRVGRVRIVHRAGQLHHAAPGLLEDSQERVAAAGVGDPQPVVNQRLARPAAALGGAGRLGPEHGVCGQNVAVRRQQLLHHLFGVLLDREHVNHELPTERVHRHGPENIFERNNAACNNDHIWLLGKEIHLFVH